MVRAMTVQCLLNFGGLGAEHPGHLLGGQIPLRIHGAQLRKDIRQQAPQQVHLERGGDLGIAQQPRHLLRQVTAMRFQGLVEGRAALIRGPLHPPTGFFMAQFAATSHLRSPLI